MGSRSSYGFAFVALGAAIWGSDALFRRGLALDLPASVVVFVEHLILVAITVPFAVRALRSRPRLTRRDAVSLFLIGAGSSALATILFTKAFTYGSPTTPLLLQKLQPLFAVAGASLLLGERLKPRFAGFFVLGIGGAFLISFPQPSSVTVDSVVAAGLAVGAAALWAMGTVLGRQLSSVFRFSDLTALRFVVGLPAAALIMFIEGDPASLGGLTGSDLRSLLLLALVPGLAALLIYYRGLRDTPASAATVAELAFPLSAIFINWIAFDSILTGSQWLGVASLSGTILAMSTLSVRSTRPLGVIAPQHETHWRPQPQVGES